jgi:trimeric autotransporter adhesin
MLAMRIHCLTKRRKTKSKFRLTPKPFIMKNPVCYSEIRVRKTLCGIVLMFSMIIAVGAQDFSPGESPDIIRFDEQKVLTLGPAKSSGFRLNVTDSDALIHGITVGRGGGAGTANMALGEAALSHNTTGSYNTASGTGGLYFNTTGFNNTANGALTLLSNTTGYANTANGTHSLYNNSTGYGNTASGTYALYSNTTGNINTSNGYWALAYNTTGNGNTASGVQALFNNSTGSNNVGIGVNALYHNLEKNSLVAVGDNALYYNGVGATSHHEAIENTALGSKTLYANTTGYGNTASGFESLTVNTTGYQNTANGAFALHNNTTGFRNTASGVRSLLSNKEGSYNTANGVWAFYSLNLGDANTAIGYSAGDYRTSISQGTFVGSGAYPSVNGLANVTGIGYNARPDASNQVRLGNSSVTSIGGYAGWTEISDGLYKTNISEEVAGLDFVLQLRPVSYNLDVHKLAADLEEDMGRDREGNKSASTPAESTLKSRDEKSAIRYTGFIAQEVEVAVNELDVAFSGVDAPTGKSGHYGLRYADFVVPIVRAIQQQQQQIETLSPAGMEVLLEEMEEIKLVNERLIASEESLRAENQALESRQLLLEAENQRMQNQINDILTLLESFSAEVQECCLQQLRGARSDASGLSEALENPRLEQNSPNPFQENTLIRYFLPEGTHSARITITDLSGNQVMVFPLEHEGVGQVIIHGGALPSGTFIYTLTVNGRMIDSKRMVLL